MGHFDLLFTDLVKGIDTPNQKLACFVIVLKIINTFMKNNMCILQ